MWKGRQFASRSRSGALLVFEVHRRVETERVMAHRWREVGRMPVTLVRSTCPCGCKLQRLELVTEDGGRSVPIDVPLARVNPRTVQRVTEAVGIGRELVSFWKRVRDVVA